MDIDAADWPLRSSTTTFPAFHNQSQHDERHDVPTQNRPSTPNPPSLFSVDDYRSILKAQSPFSETIVDEYVLDEPVQPRPWSKELYIPPRLAPRVQLPKLPTPFEQQIFPPHTSLSPNTAQSSPSLSSSVSTASSSPASLESSTFTGWPFSEVTAQLEPLRTKRHFSSLRTAKRLPHRNSPPWEVHAIIQVRETIGSHNPNGDSSSKQEPVGLGVTNGDLAQLPGYDKPPGLHLEQIDPASSSGRYVHYRGASFEVLNPHASLIYGARSFETPAAEIDGLLDDYLDSTDPLENDMERSMSSTPNDGTPSRQLYDDPEVARRNILHLPSQRGVRDSPTKASQHAGDGESAMSAILAGYEHSTYPPAKRPTSTATSDTNWLDFVEVAREVSPDLPICGAIAVLRGRTPVDTPRAPVRQHLAAGPATPYDPPTSERTYGDTNRLLQITPHAVGLALTTDTPRQPQRPVTRPNSPIEDETIHTSGINSTHGSIHSGETPPDSQTSDTDIDDSTATILFNPFNADNHEREEENDADADWVTEAANSGAGRFSLTTDDEEEDEHFDYYNYDDHTQVQPANVLDDDTGRAFRRYEPTHDGVSERQEEVERAARTLSTIYHNKMQAMAGGENITGYANVHRQTALEAEAEIERLRQENPATFSAAVDSFIARYGEHTAAQLTRIWSDNNEVSSRRRESPVSENSFDQVIRQARAGERDAAINVYDQTTAVHNENIGRAGLQYSPTTDTFATSRPMRGASTNRFFQPQFSTPPQYITMGNSHQLAPNRYQDQYRRPGLRAMASMSSQTGLRDLHLTSTPTSNINGAGQELARRPGTPMFPCNLVLADPPRRYGMDIEMTDFNPPVRPTMDATLRSINVDLASRDLLSRHLWNPVALFIIWAGGFDKVIARESRNMATEVSKETKIEALKWACLEVATLIILASVIAVFVMIGMLAH